MSNGVSEEKRIKTDDNDDCKIVGEVDYTEFLEEIDDCQTVSRRLKMLLRLFLRIINVKLFYFSASRWTERTSCWGNSHDWNEVQQTEKTSFLQAVRGHRQDSTILAQNGNKSTLSMLSSDNKFIILFLQFMNNPTLTEIIPEEQQNCLKYLSNFYVEECEDIKNGYKIIFKFDTNPYFENETLVKEWV